MYLPGGGGPTMSPTGGSSILPPDADVATDRALSARRRRCGGSAGDELVLIRRIRVCIGETGCDRGIKFCGRLWLCVWMYDMPTPAGGETLGPRSDCPLESDDDWPLARWKTETLARRAMSTSPSSQCIASAARQGHCISFAIFSHMSFLNLLRLS